MARRTILHYPDPRLRQVAKPVVAVDDEVRRLVDDMAETMYAAPGIGLAAVQVNVAQRVVVIDVSETRHALQCKSDYRSSRGRSGHYRHQEPRRHPPAPAPAGR